MATTDKKSVPNITWAQIPALSDNYIYFIIDRSAQKAAVVDPSEAAPVIKFLQENNLSLDKIILTHHHHDHVGGVVTLQQQYHCGVIAPQYDIDKGRIPHDNNYPLLAVSGHDGHGANRNIHLWSLPVEVFDLPGHTLGHVGYYIPSLHWLFSGDVIFSMTCGYLFEGDYAAAFASLQKINRLPPETLLFMAHEYSAANINFAKYFFDNNISPALATRVDEIKNLRRKKQPSVPVKLAVEQATNPFLQVNNIDDFTKLRQTKDNFSAA